MADEGAVLEGRLNGLVGEDLAQRAEGGEIQRGAKSRPQGGGDGSSPKAGDGTRAGKDGSEDGEQGRGAALLDPCLEQIRRLEENCARDTRGQPGQEVEGGMRLSRVWAAMGHVPRQNAAELPKHL